MQNIKYHIINIIAMLVFSYMSASAINEIIRYKISPSFTTSSTRKKTVAAGPARKSLEYYNPIIESGFFKIPSAASEGNGSSETKPDVSSIDTLELIGTITGPPSIARAMIKKKGDKEPGIYAVYNVTRDITSDVFGYRLYRIYSSKVYLKINDEKKILELYTKPPNEGPKKSATTKNGEPDAGGNKIIQNLSRAEIQQNVLNNMDNALKGLRAGPHRVNGKIEGYRLIRVRPENILYRLGARSGDIVKRVNGIAIDSTAKLYKMWENLKSESKIVVDLERKGQLKTFDLNITD